MFPSMTSHIATRIMRCVQKIVFVTREVGACNSKICWDIIGPLPVSPNNNSYVLSILDYFTRYAQFVPIPAKRADIIAKALFENLIVNYGSFEVLHADNSLENHSVLNAEVCKALGIYQTFIPIYRAGGNRTEHAHRTIFQCIRAIYIFQR